MWVQQPDGHQDRPVIRLFGPLTIEAGDRVLGARDLGGSRPKQVLEILLAARGHPVATDRLAELLWAGELPQNAAGSLQTFVSGLRRHLVADRDRARELVVTEAEAYRFDTGLVDLDIDRFDELVERSAHEPTRLARRSLEQALALVRGEVLEDEPYAAWAQDVRGRYQGLVLGARLDAADAALAELDYAAALGHAEEAATLDRFSERAHRTGMLALYALGRQHEALASYRRFRTELDEELGLQPTAETRALESAVLRQEDVRSLLPRPIETTRVAPRVGSLRLLGRTSELATLERAAQDALNGSFALVVVEGEAGVGKTRLLDELATSLVGVRLGRGSGSQLAQHLPYVPLAAALREALANIELDPQVRPALARIFPELVSAQTTEETPELEALERLVDVMSEHGPFALLLDDLHWADEETMAALSYLQKRCTCISAVVVATVRSEEAPVDHPVRRLDPGAVILLEPLSPAELAPLGMPDLYEATGGNPRFVAETVRTNGDHLSTLKDALLERCRAEGAWGYRVLVSASVLEHPFDPQALAALLQTDVAELVEDLERLTERSLLRVDGFGFRFRYELVREVLLSSLSPARRKILLQRLEHLDHELDWASTPQVAGSGRA